ncbi:deoxynucleotide monophosphate kinase [Rhizobium sullae]|uniref:Deoxynucleotide monophosphate kinase n=1 Tax=Rhizobium sullae TaxID=50338 RepID=A0A2N0D2Y7_RHISU|nr:deoxynucleotide monophosphate kinase [Rhizobium sullae]PKA40474.1 deoxynucleotide monophosphate kinase [Rhizobium sullae]
MTAAHFTIEGDLTAVPANDNSQIARLGAAIGKEMPGSFAGRKYVMQEHTYTPSAELAANDNLPPVVAFTGQAGSGKSTATKYLVEQHGYTLVKFAGPLKDMIRAIGFSEREIEGDLKETASASLCGKTPRHAMQTLGTEWGRNCIGESFWVGLWRWRVEQVLQEGGRVVTDDCRFPNEAKAIRRLGGDIFRLAGRGGIAGHHESERGCGDEDLVIVNDGEEALLRMRVWEALHRYG